MDPYKFYIEQISYDGISYAHSRAYESFKTWGIVCSKTPFRYYGDPKDYATRNWLDEHGEDVYIPTDSKLKKFDMEVTFLCSGTEERVKYNVKQFHLFLLGKTSKYKYIHQSGTEMEGTITGTSPRLAIFDDYSDIGWKDVRLKAFSNDGIVMDNSDEEVVLEFKVTFEVFDPFTKPYIFTNQHGTIIKWDD